MKFSSSKGSTIENEYIPLNLIRNSELISGLIFLYMQLSKHNIISKIEDSDEYFIANILSQNADIIDYDQYQLLKTGNFQNAEELIDKGYLIDPLEEEKLYRKRYLEFIDSREKDEVQLFFSVTYNCNFNCSYCYQDEYTNGMNTPDSSIVQALFDYIEKTFDGRKKYLTLFGGEPLLNTKWQKEIVSLIIEKAAQYKLDVAIVTNGYNLIEYLPILKPANIREIQVTLDGTADVHNKRRSLKDNSTTFDRIVAGIDAALESHIPVNLRMVIDKQNINELPKLANYAISKGWATNPLFKTQLGRNYELHHCQRGNEILYSRLNMYQDIYRLAKLNPEILEFHRPAFSVAKYLFENGSLPDPLFDSCPGTKTEWAFDFTGSIYSCTATVGKGDERLGSFYPQVSLDSNAVEEWENRDVLSIPECKNCELQLACGGGCGAVAKNKTGRLNSPDCRPIKELLELGIACYNDN